MSWLNWRIYAVGFVAATLAFGAGYWRGDVVRGRLDRTAVLEQQISALEKNLKNNDEALVTAGQSINAARQEAAAKDEKVREYEALLATQKRVCSILADDLRRLRAIRAPKALDPPDARTLRPPSVYP
jgi:hypothetical protein